MPHPRNNGWISLLITSTVCAAMPFWKRFRECVYRGWSLLAAHVRSNHVHTVVEAEAPPERIMNDFKAYASRRLNRMGLEEPGRKRWARHGSTRWLWKPQHVSAAIQYILAEQGETPSAFEAQEV